MVHCVKLCQCLLPLPVAPLDESAEICLTNNFHKQKFIQIQSECITVVVVILRRRSCFAWGCIWFIFRFSFVSVFAELLLLPLLLRIRALFSLCWQRWCNTNSTTKTTNAQEKQNKIAQEYVCVWEEERELEKEKEGIKRTEKHAEYKKEYTTQKQNATQ